MSLTIDEGIAQLEFIVEMLEDERDRLGNEANVMALGRVAACAAFPPLCALGIDVGEFETRKNALLTLVDMVEGFVSKIPFFVDAADAGDVERLNAATLAADNILVLITGTSAIDELATDVVILVRDIVRDLNRAIPSAPSIGFGIGAVLAAVVVVAVASH